MSLWWVFSHNDILQAELDAIIHGLLLFRSRGLIMTELEIDSEVAFNMLMRRSSEAWQYIHYIRRIRRLLVDGLAKWARCNQTSMVFQDLSELPTVIKKVIFIDRV